MGGIETKKKKKDSCEVEVSTHVYSLTLSDARFHATNTTYEPRPTFNFRSHTKLVNTRSRQFVTNTLTRKCLRMVHLDVKSRVSFIYHDRVFCLQRTGRVFEFQVFVFHLMCVELWTFKNYISIAMGVLFLKFNYFK